MGLFDFVSDIGKKVFSKEEDASNASINNGETLGSDETFYVIQKGDTLWKIAEKAYGNGAKYTAIVEANKEVIKDADKIFPGQKIRLPKGL